MIERMSQRLRDSDEVRFFLQWLRRPGQVGAVVPSSRALAAALASEIDNETPGVVVELGAGTGSVTQALLRAGIAPQQLVAVERNATFCALLNQRFSGVRVLAGEAGQLESLLQNAGVGLVKAVVSSLPLLNMPDGERRAAISQIATVLGGSGVLVQYTYGPAKPVSSELCAEFGVTGERSNWILANLPPAAIWRYRRTELASDLSRAA